MRTLKFNNNYFSKDSNSNKKVISHKTYSVHM
jgi:hypothetical protein